jgi:DNA-binding NarL/FixJ family response regulator
VQGILPRPLRVLAVNRNRILRQGISVLIEMQPDLELLASVDAADDAVSLFMEKRPDLTLMDLDLPSGGGVEAIQRIRAIDPDTCVIALVTHEGDERGVQAVDAGAFAVLAKDLIAEMLLPIIHAAVRGTRATP